MSTDFITNNTGIFKKLTDLEKTESTLVFVPMESHASEDTTYSVGVSIKAGIYFTPPGGALCAFFEQTNGQIIFTHLP